MKETSGWQLIFTSPCLDWVIERVALNAKTVGGSLGDHDKMLAVSSCTEIILWAISGDGTGSEIGEIIVVTNVQYIQLAGRGVLLLGG